MSALNPSTDGRNALIVRLFNTTDQPTKARLTWGSATPKAMWLSTLSEERGAKAPAEIEMPAWGIVTLPCEE